MEKLIFSVHEKHQANRLSSIQQVVGLFSDTLELLRGNEKYIRSEVANLPKILSGRKGNKASETATSVEMLKGIETPTVLDYPRNFGKAAKDGLKRTTLWAVYYFTNPNSWYPVLEQVTVQSIQKMRDWVSVFRLEVLGRA